MLLGLFSLPFRRRFQGKRLRRIDRRNDLLLNPPLDQCPGDERFQFDAAGGTYSRDGFALGFCEGGIARAQL